MFHETKIHGKVSFPYTVYRGKLPEYLHSYPVHWHKEMEIIYIVRGRGTVTVQTHRYEVITGNILLIQPEMLHSIEQLNDHEMEYFNILFDFNLLEKDSSNCYEKYFKSIYEHTKLTPVHLFKNEPLSMLITPHIKYLITNRKLKYTSDELMVKSNLYAIIHHINQFCKDANSDSQILEKNHNKIKAILLYIQGHYFERISVEEAAELLHYSSSYFSKLFHELTGTSFTQYLKEYRLEIAAEKLINTKMNITDISEETGFCSLPYFTRSFVRKYGVTPTTYRKKGGSSY